MIKTLSTILTLSFCALQSIAQPTNNSSSISVMLKKLESTVVLNIDNDTVQFPLPWHWKSTDDTYIDAHTKESHLSATVGKDKIFGKLSHKGNIYQLTTTKDGIQAIPLSNKNIIINQCGMDHANKSNFPIEQIRSLPSPQAGEHTVIDVYFLYSQGIVDRYPGDLLQSRLNQYVNVANQSLANSGLNLGVRIVGSQLKDYNLNENNVVLRDDLQRSLSGQFIPGIGNLQSLQSQSGADMFVYIRPHDIQTRGNCGVAFFPVYDSQSDSFDSTYGVHVMSDGQSSWSVCTDQLFIHELGHNLGAGHHNVPSEFQYLPGAAGFARLGAVTTIMGSFGTGQPERFMEVDMFSNPALNCAGTPCGTSGTFDNVSTINQIMNSVANYYPSLSDAPYTPVSGRASPDSDADGISDWDDFLPFDPSETLDSDLDGVGNTADAFRFNFQEQYDFDEDGLGDNEDQDDDNDQVIDINDLFPKDPGESQDSDRDGVGDNSDAFPNDENEQTDFDQDLLGDNLDINDDNDSFDDLSSAQDLLVINTGNNTIVRLDATTGQPKGYEVPPEDGLLTFQSDLSYHKGNNVLFYTSSSSIKMVDLNDRKHSGVIVPPYPTIDRSDALNSGFPTSLTASNHSGLSVFVTTINSDTVSLRKGTQLTSFGGWYFLQNFENIIDSFLNDGTTYFLDQAQMIHSASGNPSFTSVFFQGRFDNPYAIIASSELNSIFVSNQDSNEITVIDSETATLKEMSINIANEGYSNPTGLAITNDNTLLVAARDQNAILKYNAETGEHLGVLATGKGLDQPHKMVLVPQLHDRFHNDPEKVIRPNAGLWYNPDKNGRGFDIHIFNNRLAVVVYTYDLEGNPIWYLSSGDLNGFDYSGSLNKNQRNPDESIVTTEVGQVTIEFVNERKANIEWSVDGTTVTETIDWLAFNHNPQQHNHTGLWGRDDGPGWGVTLTTIGSTTVAVPYLYDSEGEPRWLISDPVNNESPLNLNMNATQSSTLCPSCTGTPSFQASPAGTMTIEIGENNSWSSEIDLPSPLSGDWNLNQTNIRRFSLEPTRPR